MNLVMRIAHNAQEFMFVCFSVVIERLVFMGRHLASLAGGVNLLLGDGKGRHEHVGYGLLQPCALSDG